MKFNKIRGKIESLTTLITLLGFLHGAEASSINQYDNSINTHPEIEGTQENKYDNSIKAHFEIGGTQENNCDINSKKGTLDLKLREGDFLFNIKGSQTDYSGILESRKIKEYTNSLSLGIGKKSGESLFLFPYINLTDDIDPLREFSDSDVSSLSLGMSGECLLIKPICLVGDLRTSVLNEGSVDFLVNLGIMYYFKNDFISLRGTNWKESLRKVNTAMAYLLFDHKFNERFNVNLYGGYGKEYGSKKEKIYDLGIKLSCDILRELNLEINYNHSKYKNVTNTVGVGLTARR